MKEKENNNSTTCERTLEIVTFIYIALVFIAFGIGITSCKPMCDKDDKKDKNDISEVINFKSISEYDVSLWKNEEINDKEFEKRILNALEIPDTFSFYFNGRKIFYGKSWGGNPKIDFNHSLNCMTLTLSNWPPSDIVILTNYFNKP